MIVLICVKSQKVTIKKEQSLKSTTKCRNCKVGRHDWVQIRDIKVVCEFNFSGLPLHLRQKKNTII